MDGLIFGMLRYEIQHVDVVERKSNNDMFYTVPQVAGTSCNTCSLTNKCLRC